MRLAQSTVSVYGDFAARILLRVSARSVARVSEFDKPERVDFLRTSVEEITLFPFFLLPLRLAAVGGARFF